MLKLCLKPTACSGFPDRRPMRRKIFGMIAVPLDRNEKARLLHRARAMMRATEKGRAYGQVTAKAYAVFCALLMGFHNAASGRCFPSYDRLQEAAGCCRQTVAASLAALEAAGLLGVCNRLVRVRWKDELAMATRTRVMRTSNCYAFPATATEPSKSSFPTGTGIQVFNSDLFAALDRLKRGIRRGQAQDPDRLDGARNDKMAAAPERTEAAAKMVGSEGR
jgi:Helix-turn-helix domain